MSACPTSAKLDAFAFLPNLIDAIYITHVDACLGSTNFHDAIVLLLDLVDVVIITHVLLQLLISPSVRHNG
jgi:hypothetical protein